ncbi:FliM/FliN family flagellar motor switch protein [Silvibacterium sp.]|uniref:FliM/FliN family flagellar motor switch protein n=1 Tax=Silvibacterium sp. TaxID=1964179 RepID=UPI0039E3F010
MDRKKNLTGRWMEQAAGIMAREVSAEMKIGPAAQLPVAASSLCFEVRVRGTLDEATIEGSVVVLAETEGMHALLVASGLAGEDAAAIEDWEVELWQGLVAQAVQASLALKPGSPAVAAERSEWAAGIPAAALEVSLGEARMLLAFADRTELQVVAPPPAAAPSAPSLSPGVELLVDIELEASLRFGSREMSLNEVLDLGPGDVIELDRHVAEPVDLLVGDRIVARGEVVLVDGNFGLNVTEVATAEKRLESIRCLF